MSKTQNKQSLKFVTQVTKQKTNLYPYYPVTAKFQQSDTLFLFSVQYPVGVACITFIMITKDHTHKNGVTNIELAGINDRSAVSVIQVIDFKHKARMNVIQATQATILVGYREGQLVIIKYKDRRTQLLHKFNKSARKQAFMEKMSNIFSSEQGYKIMIRGSIKTALYCPARKNAVSFLAGNTLVMYKTKQEKSQQAVQYQFRNINPEALAKGVKIAIDQGIVFTVGNKQICTYNYTQKEQIFIGYSMDSVVSCFSASDLNLIFSISLQMPVRKINYFSFPEGDFLTILPYEDYAILVNVNERQFIKLIGYRCFIANSVISRIDKNQKSPLVFVSGGLDHRVCFDKIQDLKGWNILQKAQIPKEQNIMIQSEKNGYFVDEEKKGLQFSNKYFLGEYSNARTNSHDYGFSDLVFGLGLAAFPTYDGKIKVFNVIYK